MGGIISEGIAIAVSENRKMFISKTHKDEIEERKANAAEREAAEPIPDPDVNPEDNNVQKTPCNSPGCNRKIREQLAQEQKGKKPEPKTYPITKEDALWDYKLTGWIGTRFNLMLLWFLTRARRRASHKTREARTAVCYACENYTQLRDVPYCKATGKTLKRQVLWTNSICPLALYPMGEFVLPVTVAPQTFATLEAGQPAENGEEIR